MHPAGVGREGIPQQALHSHSKSPSVPRQRSQTTLTPVHQEGFGPAPSTSSTPAPALLGRFWPRLVSMATASPGREGSALPQSSPLGAEGRKPRGPRGPPSRRPSGALLQRFRLRPEPARPSKLAPGKPGQASLRLGASARAAAPGPRGRSTSARAAAEGPLRRPSLPHLLARPAPPGPSFLPSTPFLQRALQP